MLLPNATMAIAAAHDDADWAILPIQMPAGKAIPESVTTHHIYLQPHRPRVPTADDARNLILVNVPVDSTAAHFRGIFTSLLGAGRFASIVFHEGVPRISGDAPAAAAAAAAARAGVQKGKRKRGGPAAGVASTELPQTWDRELHRSGGTAIVTLVDEKAAKAALKAVRGVQREAEKTGKSRLTWGENVRAVPALGSARYRTHHALRYPSIAELQASVDAFMTAFNAREEEAARSAKRARNVPDEDGFVTVTRGGRAGPARMEEAERKRDEMREKEEKKRREMGDFYRFQGREKRKEEVGRLRREFEEDRRRVESLKQRKGKTGFRPER